MAASSTVASAGAGTAGVFRSVEQRHYAVQLGVWCFLATVTMLFAAFSSSYIVRQAGTDWTPTPLPTVLWFNTAMLLASSAAMEVSRREARRGKMSASRVALATTVALGVSFLVGQLGAWRDLVAQGFYLPTSAHASFFYILTALHAAHLVAGLILLLWVITRIGRSERRGDSEEMPFLLGIGATFWHFFGALWVYLFAMLALV